MKRFVYFLRNSVRGRLACLALAVAVPALLLVVTLVVQAYRNGRAAVAEHLSSTARVLSSLVDHEIGQSEALLKGLATSRDLEARNFAAFDGRARAVVTGDRWIVLTDAAGQQLVNTYVPFGSPLPQQTVDGEFRATLAQGRTYVSNVIIGAASHRPMLFVAVPVMEGVQLKYILSLAMFPEAFAAGLGAERFFPGSFVTIIDRTGAIAARHPGGDRLVGTKAAPDLLGSLEEEWVSAREAVTLEGVRVLGAASRSPKSGWTVAIGAPFTDLYASARKLLWIGLIASSILMTVAVAMALWISRALVRSVDSLVADTLVIGQGDVPAERSSGLAETDFVALAMLRTARKLKERERENASLTVALQAELAKQRRAEEASRRLAAIVESSDDAILSKDLDGRITSWNNGAERMFGYKASEIIGQPVTLIFPADRVEEEQAIFSRIRRGEPIENIETVRRRRDGSLVPISLSVSPLRDANGQVLGASTIARDISHRRRTESQQQALFELVASVNRAEALPEIYEAALTAICRCQDATRAAILLCDPDGVMRFKASRGLSDEYRQAVEGHSPWPRSDPNPQPLWIDDVTNAILAPKLRQALESEGIRALAFIPLTYERTLRGKFMVYYDVPHAFAHNELRATEAIASQVTFAIERQQGADALEALVNDRTASLRQAVAQMEEFSYSVSHDLRAPVRAMRGYAEAVLNDHGDRLDAEGRELLTRILRNGMRMDRLIQDLLTYSRISRREIRLEPVSLDRLVREVVQQYPEMRPECADIEVESVLPDVVGHEPSLTQVISNLLSNAVKFVPPRVRPHVRIGHQRIGNSVRLWFQDNGIGIKPELQPRLFGMFERIHTETKYEGTGIGLAIVRKAVERMNGAVGLESDGTAGSRFWFELPLAPAGETRPASLSLGELPPKQNGTRTTVGDAVPLTAASC